MFIPLKKKLTLQKELNRLKSEKAALQVQSKLLDKFVSLARSAGKEKVLSAILQKTFEISTELPTAEKGSFFLLNSGGTVADSILTRRNATPEQCTRINDEGLHIKLKGQPHILEADTVVICAGQESKRDLNKGLEHAGTTGHYFVDFYANF
jgi:hypothetical protein